jgi:hypothetical protein
MALLFGHLLKELHETTRRLAQPGFDGLGYSAQHCAIGALI